VKLNVKSGRILNSGTLNRGSSAVAVTEQVGSSGSASDSGGARFESRLEH
jgi:hypothetical protein